MICGTPIAVRDQRGASGEPIAVDSSGMAPLIASMEALIGAHPDQWFNFYDLWPIERPARDDGGRAERRSGRMQRPAAPEKSGRAAMTGSRRA